MLMELLLSLHGACQVVDYVHQNSNIMCKSLLFVVTNYHVTVTLDL